MFFTATQAVVQNHEALSQPEEKSLCCNSFGRNLFLHHLIFTVPVPKPFHRDSEHDILSCCGNAARYSVTRVWSHLPFLFFSFRASEASASFPTAE